MDQVVEACSANRAVLRASGYVIDSLLTDVIATCRNVSDLIVVAALSPTLPA
ncbi:hypothetical protein HFN89_07090 [Rhizobium laguerreae]|nr:hypothetical protein [Rhizobium laguerreae]